MSIRFHFVVAAAGIAFAASTPAALAANALVGNVEAAKGKISMCEGCHGLAGYRTAYPRVYHVPRIGGQQPTYIMNALKEYRAGQRSHPSMRSIAGSLTDQDIADLAAYYGRKAK